MWVTTREWNYSFCEGRYFKPIFIETLNIGGMFVELTFCKKKWLICCSCNPYMSTIRGHLETLKRNLDLYSAKYENIIIIRNFNTDINYSCLKSFCETFTLHYKGTDMLKEPTKSFSYWFDFDKKPVQGLTNLIFAFLIFVHLKWFSARSYTQHYVCIKQQRPALRYII